jgi:hypothetical protein
VIAKTKRPRASCASSTYSRCCRAFGQRRRALAGGRDKNFVAGNVSTAVDKNYVAHAKDLMIFTRKHAAHGRRPDALNVKFVKGSTRTRCTC